MASAIRTTKNLVTATLLLVLASAAIGLVVAFLFYASCRPVEGAYYFDFCQPMWDLLRSS